MMQADLKRLHKYMLDIEHIDHISDEIAHGPRAPEDTREPPGPQGGHGH
jgi:hypothetical protein